MTNFFLNVIAKTLGEEKPTPTYLDPDDFESGIMLDCGIQWVYTFKKLLIPEDFRAYYRKPKFKCRKRKPECKT